MGLEHRPDTILFWDCLWFIILLHAVRFGGPGWKLDISNQQAVKLNREWLDEFEYLPQHLQSWMCQRCPIESYIDVLEAILNSRLVYPAWVVVMFQCGINHVSQPVLPYHATFSQPLLQTGNLLGNSLSIQVFFISMSRCASDQRRLLTASTFFGIQVDVDLWSQYSSQRWIPFDAQVADSLCLCSRGSSGQGPKGWYDWSGT